MRREFPTALTGGPLVTATLRRRVIRLAVASLTVAVIGVGSITGLAYADELDDQRDQVAHQIEEANSRVDESHSHVDAASQAYLQAQEDLTKVQDELAETRRQVTEAKAADEESARKLSAAQNDLEDARAAVSKGQENLAAQKLEVGKVAREQYQQNTGMVGIGMVVNGTSTGEVNNQVQWSSNMLASTQAEMDVLNMIQTQLNEAEDKSARIEREVAAERMVAAANLTRRQELEAAAKQQEEAVANQVAATAEAEKAARVQAEAEKAHMEALVAERAGVESRIADRLAEQREAEALKAIEDRKQREIEAAKAREEAEAARLRKEEADRAAAAAANGEPAPPPPPPAPEAVPKTPEEEARDATARQEAASHGFTLPSGSRITSKFGMRTHPITKVWKLHDGTDFGAPCGSPIRAAYDGVVKDRYYNAGYGNRLFIDHGRVDGRYVTTGYNHAVRYHVREGDRVKKGQVVGQVGSTGYSTGCHLHFMVWLDGKVSNPMSWYSI